MTDEELIDAMTRHGKMDSIVGNHCALAAIRIKALLQAVQHANDHADAAIADMKVVARKLEQETRRRQGMTDTAFDWKARAERLEEALEKLACECSSNCDWEHDDICQSWIARAALEGANHE